MTRKAIPTSDVLFTVFDTALGHCAIAWHVAGVVGVQLPESGEAATRARMAYRFKGSTEAPPTADIQSVIEGVRSLLSGKAVDLSFVKLDMSGVPLFNRRVYALTLAIAPGSTRTYGDIARELDGIGSARAVGQALGRNPFAPVVPCHRVLAAGGKPGGFSASGGITTKFRMLAIEGAGQTPGLFD